MFDRFKYSLIYFFVFSATTYAHQASAQISPDRSLGQERSIFRSDNRGT